MLMTSKKKPWRGGGGVGSLEASGHILHFDLALSNVRCCWLAGPICSVSLLCDLASDPS